MLRSILFLFLLMPSMVWAASIDMSGQWLFKLDPSNVGEQEKWYNNSLQSSDEFVTLPGTTDTNQKGTKTSLALGEFYKTSPQLKKLTRRHSYVGAAWYQKSFEIPEGSGWDAGASRLVLERVLWQSTVWINDTKIGSRDSLVVPHRYMVPHLPPGTHTITVRVDNSYRFNISDAWGMRAGHAYTDETQTIWNGILGEISLTPVREVAIKAAIVDARPEAAMIGVKVRVLNRGISATTKELEANVLGETTKKNVSVAPGDSTVSMEIPLPTTMTKWDEFNPVTYKVSLKFAGDNATFTTSFGLRSVATNGKNLLVNGNRVFLRGTLECAIWPNTGHPPTNDEEWRRAFGVLRDHGFNHVRFHSWTPPKAAFRAADELGLYLQVEAPMWAQDISAPDQIGRNNFIAQESYRIIEEYGNHPSFLLMSLGNELDGMDPRQPHRPNTLDPLNTIMQELKHRDSRHLYTTTTFSFIDGKNPLQEDQFFITQETAKGMIRGQSSLKTEGPATYFDYSDKMDYINMPVLSHEIGQYAVYPNLKEIDKYGADSVMVPVNYQLIEKRLKEKGLQSKAEEFTASSAHLAAVLYQAEIEAALRSESMSGFQILDIRDFPGQGTATVGLLDAFWESKGAIEPSDFKAFNGPVVPLVKMSKKTYFHYENINAQLMVANFTNAPIQNARLKWRLVRSDSGTPITDGVLVKQSLPIGNGAAQQFGRISISLADYAELMARPALLKLELSLEGTPYKRQDQIWVYPNNTLPSTAGLMVATRLTESVLNDLEAGAKVLLLPGKGEIQQSVGGSFFPIFWSPIHFKKLGTMGLINDTNHPIMQGVLAESYSNWNWWGFFEGAQASRSESSTSVGDNGRRIPDSFVELPRAMVVDSIFERKNVPLPIITQGVPDFLLNNHLAYIFEVKVGEGKLMVSSLDIATDLHRRPMARALRTSIVDYMKSDAFNPGFSLTRADLGSILKIRE